MDALDAPDAAGRSHHRAASDPDCGHCGPLAPRPQRVNDSALLVARSAPVSPGDKAPPRRSSSAPPELPVELEAARSEICGIFTHAALEKDYPCWVDADLVGLARARNPHADVLEGYAAGGALPPDGLTALSLSPVRVVDAEALDASTPGGGSSAGAHPSAGAVLASAAVAQ